MIRRNHPPEHLWDLHIKYFFGSGYVSIDLDKSYLHLQAAAELGHPVAQFFWAQALRFGDNGIIIDLPTALTFYERSGIAGWQLGIFHEFGRLGCPVDEAVALRHYQRAAELGHFKAQQFLGLVHEHGFLGCAVDWDMSLKYYNDLLRNTEGSHYMQ